MFTGLTCCIWTEQLQLFEWPIGGTFRMRLYQFLRSPSLVNVISLRADQVLVDFLASCEQLKSLTVNISHVFFKDSVIPSGVASISTIHSTPVSTCLLEELIISQSTLAVLVRSLISSGLHELVVPRGFLTRMVSELEETKAFQQVLDLCAESSEEVRIGEHLPLFVAAPQHRPAKRLLISLRL